MAGGQMQTFRQVSYCNLCRRNVSEGKSHIYSKKHKEILKAVLDKFGSKITTALKKLSTPSVHDEEWEMDKKFWCYFCEAEIDLHQKDNDLSIENGGMYLHLLSKDHNMNIKRFWKENRLDYSLQSKFRLPLDDYQRFVEKLPEVKAKYVKLMDRLQQKEIENIKNVEQARKEVVADAICELMQIQPSSSNQDTPLFQQPQMVYAFGGNLTQVEVPRNKSKGNIFTGAVPPWLQEDTGGTNQVIGPTLADFNKFKESERKKKLPKERVGANFDHAGTSSADWLPSFGRVWNTGRRWQSRHEYRRERKQKNFMKRKLNSNVSSTNSDIESDVVKLKHSANIQD